MNAKKNMPYSLIVENGHYADKGCSSREEPNQEHIGSEIEPINVGKLNAGDFENGTGHEKKWFIVVQDGKPVLIETHLESRNYGCDYMKNGGHADYTAHSLDQVENLSVKK